MDHTLHSGTEKMLFALSVFSGSCNSELVTTFSLSAQNILFSHTHFWGPPRGEGARCSANRQQTVSQKDHLLNYEQPLTNLILLAQLLQLNAAAMEVCHSTHVKGHFDIVS